MVEEITFSCSGCGQHLACAAELAGIATTCPGCQVSLIVPQAPAPPLAGPVNERSALPIIRPDAQAWKNMGLGLGIAILVAFVPLLSWIFHFLGTIIHELGHWIVAMVFAYPSVPAFGFVDGGITFTFSRMPLLLLAVYGTLGWGIWKNKGNRKALTVLGAVTFVYAFLAHSGLDQAVVLIAGHFTQLLIAGVFLYRGWAGAAIIAAAERPLYAAVGLHMVGVQLSFAFQVLFSTDYRQRYIEREDLANDFVRLSEQLGISLNLFMLLVLVSALAVPWLSYLASCHQPRWRRLVSQLFTR